MLRYVKKYVPVAGKAQLGGNSVGMDKRFLERYMPQVMDHLHYRVIDVSTIKELASRWYPAARHSAPVKTGHHRALGDIKDSIDELKYYRRAIFVEQGPDAVAAAKIARDVYKRQVRRRPARPVHASSLRPDARRTPPSHGARDGIGAYIPRDRGCCSQSSCHLPCCCLLYTSWAMAVSLMVSSSASVP